MKSAGAILNEFLGFCDSNDIRGSVLRWLSWCKSKGNTPLTLEAKRPRVASFYKRFDVNLRIPRIMFVEKRPEIYAQQELDMNRHVSLRRKRFLHGAEG